MIISKEQTLRSSIQEAWRSLRVTIPTRRGTSEARIEMMKLREQSYTSGICPYCNTKIVDRSPRRQEACTTCASRIDRLLMMKSKIVNSTSDAFIGAKAFKSFVDDLSSLQYVPLALGGDEAVRILDCCDTYLNAVEALRDYEHEQRLRRTAENLRNKRIAALRCEYSRLADKMSAEAFDELIESQYVQRYHQDIIAGGV